MDKARERLAAFREAQAKQDKIVEPHPKVAEKVVQSRPVSSAPSWDLLDALPFRFWRSCYAARPGLTLIATSLTYVVGQGFFIWAHFGSVFFVFSALITICLGLGQRAEGELSAYSVFNENCERLPGQMTAEHFEPDELGLRNNMEASHSLLLNEDALKDLHEQRRPLFVYEWLRYLDKILPVTHNAELKSIQPKLIAQLHQRLQAGVGPPTRTLLAKCIAKTYSLGDIYSVTATMNLCNDLLESKEDSAQQLSVKMAALSVLGALYESLGRLAGASYQDLFNILTKWLSRAESQVRAEIMSMLAKMVKGLGTGGAKIHKDLYKLVKKYAEDRVMVVRVAAVECLTALVPVYVPMFTTDVEAMITLATKALDNSNYECRVALTPLIDRCINRLEHLRGYADALSGYSVGFLVKNYGVRMRPLVGSLRVRLYTLTSLLNPKCYETIFAPLLRELVADLTLSDNAQATYSTSLAVSLCTGAETTLLAPWYDSTDQSILENSMNASYNGSVGSPEFDSTSTVSSNAQSLSFCWPEPLPVEVRCVDLAVVNYGRVFPFISKKHQVQITEHFASVIKEQKNPQRQFVIQTNSICAIVSALRTISEHKGFRIEPETVTKTIFEFVRIGLMSAVPTIRCICAEAIGRLAQAVGDAQYVASVAQFCFGKLETVRDVPTRTGYSLVLGCLHKHVALTPKLCNVLANC
ncbi:unnamed protein product, partial [Mesorhabditis spiculigera]